MPVRRRKVLEGAWQVGLGGMLVALPALPVLAATPVGRVRARVYVEGDRAGVVHFASRRSKDGRIVELESEVRISILGFEVFAFTQRLREEWQDDELQLLRGRTDDNGDIYEVVLRRRGGRLRGTLNERPVEMPEGAFPTSAWHYAITRQDLLFDLKDLELRAVAVRRSMETLEIGGTSVRCERFDFRREWDATAWYDQEERLVRFRYTQKGREVLIEPEL